MNCNDFINRYSDYDDSLLSQAEIESFAAHLVACPRCARYDRVLRKGRMLARQIPPTQPAPDFVPRLHGRLRELRHERSRRSRALVPGGVAPALAAVTVVLTAFWVVLLMERAPAVAAAEPGAGPFVREAAGPAVPTQEEAHRGAGSWAVLPAAEIPASHGWPTGRVDHHVPVAYSPLVTGPPAYRVAGAFEMSGSAPTLHHPE